MSISAKRRAERRAKLEALRPESFDADFRTGAFDRVTDVKHTMAEMARTDRMTASERAAIIRVASDLHDLQWLIARIARDVQNQGKRRRGTE
jgi:hypothetical protein